MSEEIINKDIQNIIYKIASKYSSHYSIEDLFQAGAVGAIKASKNYKADAGAKFTTYAYNYILGEIIDFIERDRNIRVNSAYLKTYKKYLEVKELLTQKLFKVPSNSEVALFMDIDEKLLEDVIIASEFELSLDNTLGEENENNYYEVLEDTKSNTELKIEIKQELENLSPKERELIRYRYMSEYTQRETAEYMNMSQVQVSRREARVLKKMKSNMMYN